MDRERFEQQLGGLGGSNADLRYRARERFGARGEAIALCIIAAGKGSKSQIEQCLRVADDVFPLPVIPHLTRYSAEGLYQQAADLMSVLLSGLAEAATAND